ncbi:ATP-binding protein [uncultured Duncaniella sp.]|uniref:ATP-binding protein n=1 Tax=uncultured Duncaniella sp. TaxID=2768039 RepID=UPI00272FCA3F|nr:ATP-binding protein [uncultured Duncaniella sp.]
MTQKERGAITEALRTYISKYPSRNKAAASLNGISPATLSAMLNGRHELISEEMWRNVASQVMTPAATGGWQTVETRAFREMIFAIKDAQESRKVRWITGDAGCGKTTTAGIYASENREVFTVLCDEDMRKGDFVREIARKVGFRSAGMRLRDILDTAIERLMQMDSPLLIFDEGDKLNDNVFHYFINLYNRLEGKCGIVFMSTSYIRHRIERGVSGNRKGYNEIYSRIGRKFYELEPTDGTDVASICRANGLDNVRQIGNVIKATEKSDFDLRCVKSAVHREKKMAEARVRKQCSNGD